MKKERGGEERGGQTNTNRTNNHPKNCETGYFFLLTILVIFKIFIA